MSKLQRTRSRLVFWCLGSLSSFLISLSSFSADVPIEFDTRDTKLTKIVLLAGEPSSKPGQHEYFADCALMFDWLKQMPGVWPVLVRTWPTNEAIFDGGKSIVVLMDGGT